MTKRSAIMLTIIAMLLALASTWAYAAPVKVFSGTASDSQLKPWGNGKISLEGDTLTVETKGYCEGGYLSLTRPVDLSPYLKSAKSSFVVVKMKLGQTAAPRQGRRGRGRRGRGMMPGGGLPQGPPGMPGAALPQTEDSKLYYAQLPGLPGMPGGEGGGRRPGGQRGNNMGGPGGGVPGALPGMGNPAGGPIGMPGGMMPGGGGMMPGGMMPGGGGMMPGGMMPGGMMPGGMMPGGMMPGGMMPGGMRMGRGSVEVKPLKLIRVVLVTDKGQIDAGAFDVASLKESGEYREATVPFADMKGPGATEGARLQAVVFTGNSAGTFYINGLEITGG